METEGNRFHVGAARSTDLSFHQLIKNINCSDLVVVCGKKDKTERKTDCRHKIELTLPNLQIKLHNSRVKKKIATINYHFSLRDVSYLAVS